MIALFLNGEGKAGFEAWRQQMVGGIIEITKAPVNATLKIIEEFVNSVINTINRVIRAANSVWFTFREVSNIEFKGFANGGIVSGQSISEQLWKVSRFASGGLIQWKKGIDAIPAMVSDGELILNKAQQGNLASFIRWNGGGSWTTIEVVVSWNNFYGDDASFAEKIGDSIVKQFRRNYSFESF